MTLARLAQSVEHETLNLRVVGSSPTLGVNCLVFSNHYVFTLSRKTLIFSVIHYLSRCNTKTLFPAGIEPATLCV